MNTLTEVHTTFYNGHILHYYPALNAYMIGLTNGKILPGMMSEAGAKNHIDTVLTR